jgi:O-antigen/teichoic acid export membrane protein
MGTANTILRNVASNWIGFAVNALLTLILTPYVLHALGPSRYGIWAITASVIGYYGLLDFGIRGAINQYLTRFIAVGDHKAASACLSTAVAVLGGVAMACGLITVVVAYLAPQALNLPADAADEAFWTIMIVGLTSSVQLVAFPFMSVFVATQRFDYANAIGVSTRLASALLVFAALENGYGLIGISAATCSANLLDYGVRWMVARRLAPFLKLSARMVSKTRLKELGGFGVWTFLQSVNSTLYQHAQPLIIGMLMPISAVGHYALAVGLIQQIVAVLAPIGQVIYPAATGLHARGSRDTLRRLYHDGARLMMLVMVGVVLIAAVWADDFYRLWLGERYVRETPYPALGLLLQVLLLGVVTNYTSNVAAQLLMGAGHIRPFSLLLLIGSALNLGLSLLLVGPYGLIGIAIATVIASVVIDLVAIPVLLQVKLGLSVADFARSACARPLAVACLLALVLAGIAGVSRPATTWIELVVQGMCAALAALLLVTGIGIRAEERERFIIKPLSRLARRLRVSPHPGGGSS